MLLLLKYSRVTFFSGINIANEECMGFDRVVTKINHFDESPFLNNYIVISTL